uniref:Transmembrane protein n=1 Tax=Ectopseudomonas mendocina (strain ymp) TaxID=399739 RepID=A4XQG7_ECTM1
MYKLGNFLIGFLAAVIGLLSLVALAMTGVVMALISLPAQWAGLLSMLPFLLMGICALGIWALCAGNHAGKLAFAFIMLMFWYVGTLLAALILFCLFFGEQQQPSKLREAGLLE